jgi:hypothetical protein
VAHTVFPLLLVLLLSGAAGRFESALTPRLLDEALSIGQSRIESVHDRFHQPYRLQVTRPPFDYVDVVTPFRKVVLLAEERTNLGIRGFTTREAVDALGAQAGVVEFRVEMTFHPQNVFIGVPGYDVELTSISLGGRLKPAEVTRFPRFGPRIEGAPLPAPVGTPPNLGGLVSSPLSGGTLVATFPVAALTDRVYDVVVSEMGEELARARANLAGLR